MILFFLTKMNNALRLVTTKNKRNTYVYMYTMYMSDNEKYTTESIDMECTL